MAKRWQEEEEGGADGSRRGENMRTHLTNGPELMHPPPFWGGKT